MARCAGWQHTLGIQKSPARQASSSGGLKKKKVKLYWSPCRLSRLRLRLDREGDAATATAFYCFYAFYAFYASYASYARRQHAV